MVVIFKGKSHLPGTLKTDTITTWPAPENTEMHVEVQSWGSTAATDQGIVRPQALGGVVATQRYLTACRNPDHHLLLVEQVLLPLVAPDSSGTCRSSSGLVSYFKLRFELC